MDSPLAQGFSIGDRVIKPREGTIAHSGGEVHVEPRVMDVLICLAEHGGEVVSRKQLIDTVWGHSFGADEALTRCISSLRQHLKEDRRNPLYIGTVPKRGYRLLAPVSPLDASAPRPAATTEPGQSEAAEPASPVAPAGRDLRRWMPAALVVVALAAAIILWSQHSEVDAPPKHSVAVLPFVNMSPDEDAEYFSDGLTDDLINTLSKVNDLSVVARTSAFYFKGKSEDVRVIGQKLNVRAVLEGSVRRDGDNLRVTAQLVDVEDGYHLWSGRYDRRLEDVFRIQEDISRSVSGALKVALGAGRRTAPAGPPTRDLEAYELYLKVRHFLLGTAQETRKGEEGQPTIAVLPFVDLSPGGGKAYIGDGIAEEIRHYLVRDTKLHVIARRSTFNFRDDGLAVPEIARQLGATHLLEGSVQAADERIRVTSQLIDGISGAHLWSHVHDGRAKEPFYFRRAIAQLLARTMGATLSEETAGASRGNPRAIPLYFEGRYLHQRRRPGDLAAAERAFEQALAIEPDHVGSLVGLAGVYWVRLWTGKSFDHALDARQGELLDRALAIDPRNAEALVRKAARLMWTDRERSVELVGNAAQLEPNNALVLNAQKGLEYWAENVESGLALERRLAAIDPMSALAHWNLGSSLAAHGQLQEARREIDEAIRLRGTHPGSASLHVALLVLEQRFEEARAIAEGWPAGPGRDQLLAITYGKLRMPAESAVALRRLESSSRHGVRTAIQVAEVHAFLGRSEHAFAWLETARQRAARLSAADFGEAPWEDQVRTSFFLGPLKNDPRWTQAWTALRDELRAFTRRILTVG